MVTRATLGGSTGFFFFCFFRSRGGFLGEVFDASFSPVSSVSSASAGISLRRRVLGVPGSIAAGTRRVAFRFIAFRRFRVAPGVRFRQIVHERPELEHARALHEHPGRRSALERGESPRLDARSAVKSVSVRTRRAGTRTARRREASRRDRRRRTRRRASGRSRPRRARRSAPPPSSRRPRGSPSGSASASRRRRRRRRRRRLRPPPRLRVRAARSRRL